MTSVETTFDSIDFQGAKIQFRSKWTKPQTTLLSIWKDFKQSNFTFATTNNSEIETFLSHLDDSKEIEYKTVVTKYQEFFVHNFYQNGKIPALSCIALVYIFILRYGNHREFTIQQSLTKWVESGTTATSPVSSSNPTPQTTTKIEPEVKTISKKTLDENTTQLMIHAILFGDLIYLDFKKKPEQNYLNEVVNCIENTIQLCPSNNRSFSFLNRVVRGKSELRLMTTDKAELFFNQVVQTYNNKNSNNEKKRLDKTSMINLMKTIISPTKTSTNTTTKIKPEASLTNSRVIKLETSFLEDLPPLIKVESEADYSTTPKRTHTQMINTLNNQSHIINNQFNSVATTTTVIETRPEKKQNVGGNIDITGPVLPTTFADCIAFVPGHLQNEFSSALERQQEVQVKFTDTQSIKLFGFPQAFLTQSKEIIAKDVDRVAQQVHHYYISGLDIWQRCAAETVLDRYVQSLHQHLFYCQLFLKLATDQEFKKQFTLKEVWNQLICFPITSKTNQLSIVHKAIIAKCMVLLNTLFFYPRAWFQLLWHIPLDNFPINRIFDRKVSNLTFIKLVIDQTPPKEAERCFENGGLKEEHIEERLIKHQ